MNVTTSGGDDNLKELARRLYKIRGKRAEIHEAEAVAALRKANPHLRADKPVRAGTLVVVPDVEGLHAATVPPASRDTTTQGADVLRQALDRASRVLLAAARSEQSRQESMSKSLEEHLDEELDSSVRAGMTSVQHAAKDQIKALEEHSKRVRSNIARVGKDLDNLLKKLHAL